MNKFLVVFSSMLGLSYGRYCYTVWFLIFFSIERKSRCVTKSKKRGRAYVTAAAAATMEQDKREKSPKILLNPTFLSH